MHFNARLFQCGLFALCIFFLPLSAQAQMRAHGHPQAQNPAAIMQLFGGMIAAGAAAQASEQWSHVSQFERKCADGVLRAGGNSLQRVVASGIGPSDPRLGQMWEACYKITRRQLKQNFSCPMTENGITLQSRCNEEFAVGQPAQKLTRDQALDAFLRNQNVLTVAFERLDAVAKRRQALQATFAKAQAEREAAARQAQPLQSNCVSIADTSRRLACYDSVSKAATPPSSSVVQKPPIPLPSSDGSAQSYQSLANGIVKQMSREKFLSSFLPGAMAAAFHCDVKKYSALVASLMEAEKNYRGVLTDAELAVSASASESMIGSVYHVGVQEFCSPMDAKISSLCRAAGCSAQ